MYVERLLITEFGKRLAAYNLVALVGPRQAGKTTLVKAKLAPSVNASYVSLDDPDARALFDEDVKKFEIQYIRGKALAALDEVHYGKDAGIKLKYLSDKGHKLIITSSSETLLGKDVLSHLVGRATVLRLYGFSLPEFLSSQSQKQYSEETLRRMIWEHAIFGAYPKVVLTPDVEMKKTILRDIYTTLVYKDVAQTFSINDMAGLEKLVRHLSFNMGGMVSYDAISSALGMSFQTLKKYMDALEKSYLIVRVPPFYSSKAKEAVKQPRLYFVDNGMRNAISGEFPQNMENEGKLFESYVFTELLKKGFSMKYWRTKGGAEVDFVLAFDSEIVPLEVKLRSDAGKIPSGLRSFIEAYSPKRAFVVSYSGKSGETSVGKCTVQSVRVDELLKNL